MGYIYPEPIILASRSPRRQELLTQIGVKFELLDVEIDETALYGEAPRQYVERIAQAKAHSAWQHYTQLNSRERKALLAADTSVVLEQQILGKPASKTAAREMLASLSGQTHQVITCVALIDEQGLDFRTSVTQVTFASISENAIADYCETGEGTDKAGSYAIQGLAARFIQSINGSYSGVVGLPLYETAQLLDNHFKVNQ